MVDNFHSLKGSAFIGSATLSFLPTNMDKKEKDNGSNYLQINPVEISVQHAEYWVKMENKHIVNASELMHKEVKNQIY